MKVKVKSAGLALSAITVVFTFVPEELFVACPFGLSDILMNFDFTNDHATYAATVINRLICFLTAWAMTWLGYRLYLKIRRHITIKGRNYVIRVKYGDILKEKNCKRVINFDECYTTTIGDRPEEINENSICGKYLKENRNLNINQLIKAAEIRPANGKSEFQQKTKYKPGTIVANGSDLLMAFAPLDPDGRGRFHSIKEYKDCLSTMWNELDKHYGQKDVCIPILGAGITRIGADSTHTPTQQELLDIMIWSYKLSPNKVKLPYKLRIICQRRDGFTLSHIDGVEP